MKNICLLILLNSPLILLAQSNYKQGYVVNSKGDTIRGFINYRAWTLNPETFGFKTNLTDKQQTLKVKNIQSFQIDGFEAYEQKIVNISMDATDPARATLGIDTSSRTDTVFLKVLQKGKAVKLYSYTDNLKTRFYIQTNDQSVPQELVYRVYRDNNNTSSLITINTYYSQLITLAKSQNLDPDKLTKQTKNLSYTEADILKVVSLINGFDLQHIAKPAKKNYNTFFVGIGANLGKLQYTGSDNPFSNGTTSATILPMLSFGYNITSELERFTFRMELTFSMENIDIKGDPNSPNGNATDSFKPFTVAFSPQFIYNFYNTKALKIFVGTGFSINTSYYAKTVYTLSYNYSSVTSVSMVDNFPKMSAVGGSVPLKAGITINSKFQLYATYNLPFTDVTYGYANFSGKLTTYQAGINYVFGKH